MPVAERRISLQHAVTVVVLTGILTSPVAEGWADAQRSNSPEPRQASSERRGLSTKRPYNVVMKDVGSTFDTLRKAVEGNDDNAAALNADKLEGLFKETEDFWTPFKTRDAIDAARSAREASTAVAAAARSHDGQKAKTLATGIGRSCAACHNSHREQMPDKSYRIRP